MCTSTGCVVMMWIGAIASLALVVALVGVLVALVIALLRRNPPPDRV
jgi:predicted membrane-bound mannosyltransferase